MSDVMRTTGHDDSIEGAVEGFRSTFCRLDLDGMMNCFSCTATAFFPLGFARERLEGTAAIRSAFAGVHESVRATGATQIDLQFDALRIQEYGDSAVVTFFARADVATIPLGRRTLVLHRQDGRWQIVHLHGSNVSGAH